MRRLLAPICLFAALGGCQQAKEITISDGWLRLAAAPGRPAAAYFTLHGGATDATLLSVTSPVAIRTELHESMKQGAAMTMRPLQQVALPAGQTVTFAPGGKHLMVFDVNPVVKPGGGAQLEFTFADGLRLQYTVKAVGAGDPPPKF
ncbi:MAG: copper chaperone PCu(A)C [Pseudomonadota bacterium]